MTREEHLKFCKTCTKRILDRNVGLICSLTNEKADFENECEFYEIDEKVVEKMDTEKPIEHKTVLTKLSSSDVAKFKEDQNLPKAIITGITVGILGALLWGTITVFSGLKIGYIAIIIGFGVGISMRYAGKGISLVFGISGGIIAVASCIIGNFLSIIGFIAHDIEIGYLEVLELFNFNMVLSVMIETFSLFDILFYGFAAYGGYNFAFRKFTERDLYELGK